MTAAATPPTQGFTPEVHWGRVDGQLKPYSRDPDGNIVLLTWAPMPGSQKGFMECAIQEVCYAGTRGPGKTDALLMSFAQHIGKWGKDWRGIIFRRTYPELEDIIGKADKWFTEIFPEATYNKGKHFWEWPTGERLYFGHMRVPADYNKYHGHNYPFIGWEELTTWPSKDCFVVMLSTNRTTNPQVPKMIRATTNPHGSGHNWVKARYKLPVKDGKRFGEICGGDIMVDEKGRPILDNQGKPMYQPERIAIHGDIDENFLLLDADPGYKATIAASASSPSQLKAWLHGSWDVVAGGMFDDLWDSTVHIVEPFKIPKSWRIDRSFDWGSSKPSSVGWWAESDGSDYIDAAGFRVSTVRGDLFRIHEWYMCKKGEENKGLMLTDREIANGIKELQTQHPMLMGKTIQPGPADTSIYDTTNGQSIAKAMADMGVRWTRADKSSGSRILGWQRIRNRLQASFKKDGLPREHPGLFVFDTCDAFIRTVPVIPRDDKNTDDVDCFVAGTMISTIHGDKPIEDVLEGEWVHTPIGPRRVTASHVSGMSVTTTVTLSNGESLTGTPDHRVFVEGRGLVELKNLCFSDILKHKFISQGTPEWLRASNTEDRFFDDTGGEFTTPEDQWHCTEKFGKTLTGQFPQDSTSTIETTTPTITSWLIWNSWKNQSTVATIGRKDFPPEVISLQNWLNGEQPRKVRRHLEKMLRRCVIEHPFENLRAIIVECLLRQGIPCSNVVQNPVPCNSVKSHKCKPAKSVAKSSLARRGSELPGPAVTNVAGNFEEEPVYNLTIEQAHLFYANGFLVTNTEAEDHICDEMRYKIFSRTGKMINKRIRGR